MQNKNDRQRVVAKQIKKALKDGTRINKARICMKAGYSRKTSYHNSNQIVKNCMMKDTLEDIGVTQQAIGQAIKDGLTAKKKTNIDHKVRLDSAKLASTLRGEMTERLHVEGDISTLSEDELNELAKGLDE